MTDTTPRRPIDRRVLLACAVLAAATLTGFLVRHTRPEPDGAASVPWSTVCDGHGGDDLHRLLGKGPTVAETWQDSSFTSQDGAQADLRCVVSAGAALLSVAADRLDPTEDPAPGALLARTEPGGQRFTAGDSALVGSKGAAAVVTCRAPASPAFHAEIEITLTGPPTRNPDRARLMENVVRDWAKDLESSKNCGLAG